MKANQLEPPNSVEAIIVDQLMHLTKARNNDMYQKINLHNVKQGNQQQQTPSRKTKLVYQPKGGFQPQATQNVKAQSQSQNPRQLPAVVLQHEVHAGTEKFPIILKKENINRQYSKRPITTNANGNSSQSRQSTSNSF